MAPGLHGAQGAVRRLRPILLLLPALLLTTLLLTGALPALLHGQEPVEHAWQRVFYGALDGQESLLFAARFDRARPAVADLDGDGDLDLLVGTNDGTVMYFENQGTPQAPRWRLANPAIRVRQNGRSDADSVLDVGQNAAPTLVDIDGDGDLDLFVGSAAGRVAFLRNEGNRFLPTFRLVTPDYLGAKLGLNLVVRFPDLNGDGLPDLSLGNEAGEFSIALNQGSRSNPRFCLQSQTSPDCLSVLTKLGQLSPEDNAAPEWSDWDRDGDLDLFVGKSDGTVAYYQNIGSAREGAWELAEARFNLLDGGGFAAPVFADVTGDGVPDLLLAGDGEAIAYYTRRPKERQFTLWLESRNVLAVRRLGGFQSRIHVATGDLDGDGDADLVVGTRGGELLVYENVGGPQGPAFRSPKAPLLPTPQRAFAAPALVDVDGDGDLDLIVGGREGRLEWIENSGTPKLARWTPRSLFFARVDVGSLSAPLFTDVDGDGDADLLVGTAAGQVVLYENTGSAKRPEYVLRTSRFAGLDVPSHASPAVFAWNPQAPPNLVLGNQAGTLVPAVRNPAINVAQRGAYQREIPWRGGLQADSYSAPAFVDLSGDGRPDLLLGTGLGALLLWRYEGTAKPVQVAARDVATGSNALEPPVAQSGLEGGNDGSAGASSAGGGGALADLPLDPIFVYEPSALEALKLGRGTKPAWLDANGDGRPDLVVGTRAGELVLLEQGGPVTAPTWKRVTDAFAGYAGGRNAAPAFADLDGDGDLDLAVGNEEGLVQFYERAGSRGAAQWVLRPEPFAQVRAGKNAVPAFTDLNGDGRPDLLLGNLKGELLYYINTSSLTFVLEMRRFMGLDVGVNASPAVAALTEREPFLIVGSDQGAVRIFATTGTSRVRSSGWKENRAYLEGLRLPQGTHAAFADLDGDGDLDLVLGSDQGPLRLYRNQARGPGGVRTALLRR